MNDIKEQDHKTNNGNSNTGNASHKVPWAPPLTAAWKGTAPVHLYKPPTQLSSFQTVIANDKVTSNPSVTNNDVVSNDNIKIWGPSKGN